MSSFNFVNRSRAVNCWNSRRSAKAFRSHFRWWRCRARSVFDLNKIPYLLFISHTHGFLLSVEINE